MGQQMTATATQCRIGLTITGPEFNTVVTTASYSAKNSDAHIFCDGLAMTITLPNPAYHGEIHTIKDASGAAGTNNITVSGNGNTIDGAATQTINTNYGKLTLAWNETEWSIV